MASTSDSGTGHGTAHGTGHGKPGRGKATTPPKGRPTRARGDVDVERRIFGPVAQWIALAVVIAVVVVVLILVTGGGEFEVPGIDQTGGVIAPVLGVALGLFA